MEIPEVVFWILVSFTSGLAYFLMVSIIVILIFLIFLLIKKKKKSSKYIKFTDQGYRNAIDEPLIYAEHRSNENIKRQSVVRPLSGIYVQKNKGYSQMDTRMDDEDSEDESTRPHDFYFDIDVSQLQLETKVGAGASSSVYVGKFKGSAVSVKQCPIVHLMDNPLDLLKNECRMLALCSHPNILRLLGFETSEDYFFIVTEYANMGSLAALIHPDDMLINAFTHNLRETNEDLDDDTKVSFSFEKKLYILYCVASALSVLEQHGMIHRDLKLANILLDGTPEHFRVMLCDFGAAMFLKRPYPESFFTPILPVERVGTVELCPPEVITKKGNGYTKKSDQYAFGIIMWELFTESQLYPDMVTADIEHMVANEAKRPTLPTYGNDSFPHSTISEDRFESYFNLVTKCWDQDPQLRPSWSTILEDLETLKTA